MNRLLVATSNNGKFLEFSNLICGLLDQIFSLKDYPGICLPPEDGDTFRENALIKARYAANIAGVPAIADDSGLEVTALNGNPGVRSARYAGEGAGDGENNARLLKEMIDIPPGGRGARFVCCIAYCTPDGECVTFEGELRGEILLEPKGSNGFGYDPLFFVTEYRKSMAELDMSVKNSISHRAKAFDQLRHYLAGKV